MVTMTPPTPSIPASPPLLALFAHNLLVARQTRDWTQQQLASAAGLSRATIAQLESGTGDPKLSTIDQLASALGISPLLLLLGPAELDALASQHAPKFPAALTSHPSIATMRHLRATGFIRNRLQASSLGVQLAQQAGLGQQHAGAIGAAIGSFHLPGPGTLAASAFAHALFTSAHPSPASALPQ